MRTVVIDGPGSAALTIDAQGTSVHQTGPAHWSQVIAAKIPARAR